LKLAVKVHFTEHSDPPSRLIQCAVPTYVLELFSLYDFGIKDQALRSIFHGQSEMLGMLICKVDSAVVRPETLPTQIYRF
jgi:hypothetical protein